MRYREPVNWMQRFDRHARRTVAEAFAKYLAGLSGASTKRRTAYAIKSLNPYVGHLLLWDLNDDALSQFKHDRANGLGSFDRPASSGTINIEIGLCSTVLNAACREWEWIPRALKLKLMDGPRKQAYPLTWPQQDALFAELPRHWAEGIALFGFNTGCRPDELMSLRWDQYEHIQSLNTGVFVLSRTKNGEARVVICNSLALLAVERQRGNGSEYVFPSRSGRSKDDRLTGFHPIWYDAWKAAGLPTTKWIRRGPHNMRHTFGYRLREAGVSEEDRDLYLGHKRKSLSQHYAMTTIGRLAVQSELVTRRTDDVILRRVVG